MFMALSFYIEKNKPNLKVQTFVRTYKHNIWICVVLCGFWFLLLFVISLAFFFPAF